MPDPELPLSSPDLAEAELPFEPNRPDASELAAEEESLPPERIQGLSPDEIDAIPQLPGVYIMRDGADKVLYIGKAANLASRVRSYFTKAGDLRFNVRYLMRHVARIETIITANEKEAFLLEDALIKKHQPRYNLRLRDDKTYVSVRFNMKHEFPRAVVLRRRETSKRETGVLYLGPYSSAAAVRDALRQLQRIFPIRSCPDHVLRNRVRPCLLHQIGRCCAPCTKPVDPAAYRELVDGTVLVLKGRAREVTDKVKDRMRLHAEALEFEQAAALRDRLRAIELTAERQGVFRHEGGDRDVVVFARDGGFGAFVVFGWRGGVLASSRPFLVRDHGREDDDMMEEFLGRFYQLEPPPAELIVAPLPRGVELLESMLTERRESNVTIAMPQRGEKVRLIETAMENAKRLLAQHLSGQKTIEEIDDELVAKFNLPARPESIECFDISTIQGTATVGSTVCFRAGEPDKSRYRRFRIKSVEGQDDFASMHEMLTRRFRRVAEGTDAAPGLAVIDGGKGQLAVAVDVFEKLGVKQPVVAMAKSRLKKRGKNGEIVERTEERFFLPGRANPVTFREGSPALHMLVRLRDEAHRFAITYHRELRGRRSLRSGLEDIEGVGKTRANALLRHFGSMKRLRQATADQIAEAKSLTRPVADRIHAFLHPPSASII